MVVSAVAAFAGGPFTILEQAVEAARRSPGVNFAFLVHDAARWHEDGNLRFVPLPWARRSYTRRVYAEYVLFPSLSRRWHPDAWLSLHDTTPPVRVESQAVYCHNPLPYWHPTLRDLRFDRLEFARSFLYGVVMRAFASRNDHVVGQLPWYTEFIGRYMRVPRDRLLVVAPRAAGTVRSTDPAGHSVLEEGPHDRFECVYIALPRVFKNFEEAIDLCDQPGLRLTLTISGEENLYARHVRGYARTRGVVRFAGPLSHGDSLATIATADAVLFPSRLETYGLPVQEAMDRNRVVVLPVRPWTVSVAGGYDRARFYRSVEQGRAILAALARGEPPTAGEPPRLPPTDLPRLPGFEELYGLLVG